MFLENVTIDKNLWETFARNDYDVSNYHVSRAASTYLEDYQNQDYTSNFAIAKAAISCKPMPGKIRSLKYKQNMNKLQNLPS